MDTMFDCIITLSNDGILHQVYSYDTFKLLTDIGGYTLGLFICLKFVNSMRQTDSLAD